MDVTEIRYGDCPCVKIEGIKNFDIGKIFDCGQCFRFDKVKNSIHQKEFSGIAFGRLVSFAQDGDVIFIYGSDLRDFEEIWKRYLDIERDYDAVCEDILSNCDNEALKEAIEYGKGIRILSQDPFECVISFIISQNNNIPRIKKIIEALCAKCGSKIQPDGEMEKHLSGKSSLCSFPDAQAIYSLGVDGLFELKTGFRARYIYDAVFQALQGGLSFDKIMNEQEIEKCIQALCVVKGIGNKVASCILLFGFGKYNAFPIDVWMKRVAAKYFADFEEKLSWERFGSYAGIAQQYLFYYERYRSFK